MKVQLKPIKPRRISDQVFEQLRELIFRGEIGPGQKLMTEICEEFGRNIKAHMDVYGADNDQRLTGLHETQSIDKFSYGVSDRGASIRIPVSTIENKWRGRLEDRRPASNADPYKVAARIVKTVKAVKVPATA